MSRSPGTPDTRLSTSPGSSYHTMAGIRNSGRLRGMVRRRAGRMYLAISVWALSPGLAHAALVHDTAIVSFSDSASVTDAEGNPKDTSNDDASLGTSELEQFDASLGVLTGVTINLDSTRTQTVTVSVPAKSNKPPVSAQSAGTGGSTASISAPGVSYTFTPEINASATCSGTSTDACSNTYSPVGVATNENLSATSSLDSYVGSGTVTVSRTTPTFYATQKTNEFNGKSTTQYNLDWAGKLSATYTYLLHAAPSFDSGSSIDSLTLEFGSVEQNSSIDSLGFSIFNLADANSTDLDLTGFSATGDTGVLQSDLATFTNLSQGSEQLFYATLDTATSGSFSVTYKLTLSDAANIGATDSQHSYYMYLTLTGTVDAGASVPVPDAFWLFVTGLVGIVGIARHNTPLDS